MPAPRRMTRASLDDLHDWLAALAPQPFCVGMQGLQGSGKTTACRLLCASLAQAGRRAVALSLDDFYLPHRELRGRARGPPSTYDAPLLAATLRALRDGRAGTRVRVPVYDKAARGGHGDRVGWREVDAGGLHHVLLEGWCLGYRAGPPGVVAVDEREALRAWAAQIYPSLDAFVVLEADAPERAYAWREEAEAERRARDGGAGLARDEVTALVDRCLPLCRACRCEPPPGVPVLRVPLGAGRLRPSSRLVT